MSSKKRNTITADKRILQYSLTAAAVLAGTSSLNAQVLPADPAIGTTLSNNGEYYDVQFNGSAKFRIGVTKTAYPRSSYGSYIPGHTTRTYNRTTTTTLSGAKSYHYTHSHYFPPTGVRQYWSVINNEIRINHMTSSAAGAIYAKLDGSAAIGTASQFFNTSNLLARSYSNRGGFHAGAFIGETDKFIGVRFTDGGNTHYGWIKVTVAGDAGSITIISAAYESTADLRIGAGLLVSLPVELTSFTGALTGSSVSLKWNTATEVNNYGFEIERRRISNRQITKSSVENWLKIGFVKGNGTSNSPKEYSFIDAMCTSGAYEYRLKQIDNNGSFKYSQSVELSVTTPEEFMLTQNYPNPFNPSTAIGYDVPVIGIVVLKVYNTLGQEVKTLVNETKEAGSYTAHFDASNLPSGLYFAKLTVGDVVKTIKMTLLK